MDVSYVWPVVEGLLSHALWALVVGIFGVVALVFAWLKARPLISYRLGDKLRSQGLTRFMFSRNEYPEKLNHYLDRAKHSIEVVSISFRLTSDESSLLRLFSKKLASNDNFSITISLLKPRSNACTLAAESLGLKPETLGEEIQGMLDQLAVFRSHLSDDHKRRFHVRTHSCFPMGSAILLDATPEHGTIQVETKLYRAPRVESFSFEISGPSEFYSRNLTSWRDVLGTGKSQSVAAKPRQR